MRGSEPRMNPTISFVERFDDFPAQGQKFFVRRQGHDSVLRRMVPPSATEAIRREINAKEQRVQREPVSHHLNVSLKYEGV